MVLEIADITVHPGSEDDFVAAYREAAMLLSSAPGCRSVRLTRGIESPARFVLIVEWDSVEAHTEGFRESADFGRWRELVGPYFAGTPRVEHFTDLSA